LDDDFGPLFSQPSEGPSQPVEDNSPVEEVASVRMKYVRRRQPTKKNEKNLSEPWNPQEKQMEICRNAKVFEIQKTSSKQSRTMETTSYGTSDSTHVGLDLNDEAAGSEDVELILVLLTRCLINSQTKVSTPLFSSRKESSSEYSRIKERELEMEDSRHRETIYGILCVDLLSSWGQSLVVSVTMEWLPMYEKLEKANGGRNWSDMMIVYCREFADEHWDFSLRVNRLIGDLREACKDRVAFVQELWSVVGENMPAKTAVFLEEMMNKKGSKEWLLCDLEMGVREMGFEIESFLLKLMDKEPYHRRVFGGDDGKRGADEDVPVF
nr:hypothetical protein [Tanacetum cinerariifolium]